MTEPSSQQRSLPDTIEQIRAKRAVIHARSRKMGSQLGHIQTECALLENDCHELLTLLDQFRSLLQAAEENTILSPQITE